LILRFLALANSRDTYEKPMKSFLNEFMKVNRKLGDGVASEMTNQFDKTIERAHAALGGRAFRPQRSMNVAVFDALMVAILERPDADSEAIRTAYSNLIKNEEFMKMSSDATSDESNVHGRIDKAIEAIDAAT